jgi:hypothetical protein
VQKLAPQWGNLAQTVLPWFGGVKETRIFSIFIMVNGKALMRFLEEKNFVLSMGK